MPKISGECRIMSMSQVSPNFTTTQNSESNQLQKSVDFDVDKNNLILKFEKEIPEELRASFGDYFFGIKDFIKFCFGRNIGLTIEINGKLTIKAFSKDLNDRLLVEVALTQFVNNLNNLFQNKKPILDIPVDLEIKNLESALIVLDSKSNMLELNIRLNTSLSIQTEFNDVKQLVDNVISSTKKVIGDLELLKSENNELYKKISTLQTNLLTLNQKNLVVDEKLDILLSYIVLIKEGLEKRDIKQVESMKLAVINFWKVNQEQLKLISVGASTLYNIIKVIFKL